jgi:hypothetical protein
MWSLLLTIINHHQPPFAGTINHGAVRGAVDEFALKHGLFVSVT